MMWSCTQLLTIFHLPPELPHWWGGRRGRAGGGWAILWGAADRDGMGGPGGGRQGSQRRSNSPQVTTLHHHTRHTPPPDPAFLFFLFLSFFSFTHTTCLISCYGGLTCACLCWTLPTSQINVADSIVLLPLLAWLECREMVQLKTTKWKPGQNKPLSLC